MLKSYSINEKVVEELDLTTRFVQLGYISEIALWQTEPFVVEWGLPEDILKLQALTFEIQLEKEGFRLIDKIYGDSIKRVIKYGETVVLDNAPLKIILKENYSSNFGSKYRVIKSTLKQATNSLISSVKIENVGNESEVLSLTMNGENFNRTEDVLNKLIDLFDMDGINDRQKVSERTIEFVKERFFSLTK